MSNEHHHYEHDQWSSSWSMIIIKLNDHHDLIATSGSRCCAWCTSSSRRTSGSEGTRQRAPCPRPRTPPPPTSSSFQRLPLLRLTQLLSRLAMKYLFSSPKTNLSQSAVQAAFNDHQTGGTEENDFELGVDFDDMVRSVCRRCTFDSFTNHVCIWLISKHNHTAFLLQLSNCFSQDMPAINIININIISRRTCQRTMTTKVPGSVLVTSTTSSTMIRSATPAVKVQQVITVLSSQITSLFWSSIDLRFTLFSSHSQFWNLIISA